MMNSASKSAFFFFSACILLAVAFFLRVIPTARIWPDYQVVYVSNSEDLSFLQESSVQDLFPGLFSAETGRRSDRVPLPDFSVSDSVYHGIRSSSTDPYIRDGYTSDSIRSFFFSDRDGNYKLIYVPDGYFRKFCQLLDARQVKYGSDSYVKVPYGGGIAAVVLALIMIFLVRPPLLHDLMLIPLVLCSFFAPWYSVNCAVFAVLGLFPFVNRYWNRVKGVGLFISNSLCIVFVSLTVVLLIMTPLRPLLISVLCIGSSGCFGLSVRCQEQWAESTRHFSFTPILSGKFVTVERSQKLGGILIYSMAVLVVLGISLFPSVSGTLSSQQGLSLPGPELYTELDGTVAAWENLVSNQDDAHYPDVTDFVAELWQRQSYPYRHFGQETETLPRNGSAVTVSHFVEDEGGVHEVQKDVFVFDDSYVGKSLTWLAENDSAAAFLLNGNRTATTTYTTTGTLTVSAADYVGIFISLAAAACLCIICMIKNSRQRSIDK